MITILGADQPRSAKSRPRRGSNATWTIGALPANYNVRFLHPPTDGDLVLKRGSANVSDSLFGAVDGPRGRAPQSLLLALDE